MDVFGTVHGSHPPTAGMAEHMKLSAAGLLLNKELKCLKGAVDEPTWLLCAVIGGDKVSTNLPVILSLTEKCDSIILGSGMTFASYWALCYDVGKIMVEEEYIELAGSIHHYNYGGGVYIDINTIRRWSY